jgi:hypothetical protein
MVWATVAGSICSQARSPLWIWARMSGVRIERYDCRIRESARCGRSRATRRAGGAREAVSPPAQKSAMVKEPFDLRGFALRSIPDRLKLPLLKVACSLTRRPASYL